MEDEMDYKLPESELRLIELIWEKGEINSTDLVKACEEAFRWKKSTTYTLLKRLSNKEMVQNQEGNVSALITRQEYETGKSRQFIEESFNSSLPRFLAAFSRSRALNKKDIDAIKKMIDQYEEE